MKRYTGGEKVPRGVYFNVKMWEFVQFEKDEAPTLPGGEDARYIKVPAVLALFAGPLGGLVFVIFLPLVGIIGLASFTVYKVARLFSGKAAQPPAAGRNRRLHMSRGLERKSKSKTRMYFD